MSKYEQNEKVGRGQTLRTEHTRDRSDDPVMKENFAGREMGGGKDDLSHSITKGNKVPQD